MAKLEVVAVPPKSQVRPSGVATGASNAAITFRAAAAKAGSAKVGTGDAISTLRATAAGADLRIIGNCFMNTSFETVRTDKDHAKPGVTLAVNSLGDFTHVMLIHPLQKRGIDLRKVNVISMGGSGTRLRALIAGRVDAVPLHFDQVQDLAATGK